MSSSSQGSQGDGPGTARTTSASYVTTAGADGTWRQKLPPTPASKTAYSFGFASDSALKEQASIMDVLFGDVYLVSSQRLYL